MTKMEVMCKHICTSLLTLCLLYGLENSLSRLLTVDVSKLSLWLRLANRDASYIGIGHAHEIQLDRKQNFVICKQNFLICKQNFWIWILLTNLIYLQ